MNVFIFRLWHNHAYKVELLFLFEHIYQSEIQISAVLSSIFVEIGMRYACSIENLIRSNSLISVDSVLIVPYLHQQKLKFQRDLGRMLAIHSLQIFDDGLLVIFQLGTINGQGMVETYFWQRLQGSQQFTQ